MRENTGKLKANYIIVLLFAAFVGFIMTFMGIQAENRRKAQSDFSEGWSADGKLIDMDAIVTQNFGGEVSVSKALPQTITYNDAICFMSTNIYFDVFIGEELVYSFIQPVNFTGHGYGTAYHAINLSPEQAGKNIRIHMTGAFVRKTSGRIRMISLENSRKYFSRLVHGQILSFVISAGISLLGILLLVFLLIVKNPGSEIDTFSLAITAVITGTWMALDTGFLRLVADDITVSRNLYYICMHLCFLPLVLFVYSICRSKKRILKWTACAVSAVYYTLVLILRFVFDKDMASNNMIRFFFLYALLMIFLMAIMILRSRRYDREQGIKREASFFMVGMVTVTCCALVDGILYICGVRSISGYATFSRVGCFVFFLNMCVEVGRIWAQEYASLREYGFADALTEVGNRRSYIEFDEKSKDVYPYGFVMCDINALKMENDLHGHDAGDRLIKTVADKLVEVFGIGNVFRVGGDEFIAYCFETSKEAFQERLEKIKNLLSEKDASASVGGVYVSDASFDKAAAKKKAEELMYMEKEHYYTTHHDRRR